MGALRNSIKVLFDEQQIETVISVLISGVNSNQWSIAQFEEESFVSAYIHVCPSNTRDQARSAYHIMKDKWMNSEEEVSDLQYSQNSNVFNVLLHFSRRVLSPIDNMPICIFDHLLKWHDVTYTLGEDLFTTSFFASKDIVNGYDRLNFSWPIVVGHDHSILNQLYRSRMADIHNHLKGAGFVSELNWLSLMNDVTNRKNSFVNKTFSIYKAPHLRYHTLEQHNSLYANTIKAVALRIYLFAWAFDKDKILEYKELHNILEEESDAMVGSHLFELTQALQVAKKMYAQKYRTQCGHDTIIDYAIPGTGEYFANNPVSNINFVLSGERYLMYRLFKKIFRNEEGYERLSELFYLYLLLKNEFQQELVQTNGTVGFGNFSDYEHRKGRFLKEGSIYEHLLCQTAVESSLEGCGERYLETRITPEETMLKTQKKVARFDKEAQFVIGKVREDLLLQPKEEKEWDYVVHFLKKEEKKKNPWDLEGLILCPRDGTVRRCVMAQSIALKRFRSECPNAAKRIVGIDAASAESSCRPEVFAHAFRYLRKSRGGIPLGEVMSIPNLGVTYHVGEDFYDIVDGLRAVKEALMFLEMRNGDRIGHGLVLGTDVERYYRSRDYAIPMPIQCILDNVVFLLIEGSTLTGFDKIRVHLEQEYEKCFRIVFGKTPQQEDTYYTYYQSWLLRGDEPEKYRDSKHIDRTSSVSLWQQCNVSTGELQLEARKNDGACGLYYRYHFDAGVKVRGGKFAQLVIPRDAIPVIEQLQEKVLTEVERKHISIECNPTSNRKIGEMERFIDHPISKFYNNGLYLNDPKHPKHQLTVSINTDDKGVFSTSLEREFALIAAAYDKEFQHDPNKTCPHEICSWLNEIREMAFEQCFVKRRKYQ